MTLESLRVIIVKRIEVWYNRFMKDFLLLFFNVLLTVMGQILFKHGMNTVGRINSVRDALEKLTQAFLNPYVLSGIAIYGFTTLVWLVILSRVKLSIAYPMLSSGYVLSILFSWMLFKESIPKIRMIGALIICIGVYLVAQGES
jgi:drug/metabolite transporter (DMT)-like permease